MKGYVHIPGGFFGDTGNWVFTDLATQDEYPLTDESKAILNFDKHNCATAYADLLNDGKVELFYLN